MMEFLRTIDAVDAHTAGEPIRVVTAGIPKTEGRTMLEKMAYFGAHYDDIRCMLLKEPRGHKDMFGAVLVPPVTDDADLGVLFMHNEGMSTMCGHGIIGTVKAAAETGLLPLAEGLNTVKIDAPAGRITADARVENGRVTEVGFTNVPAFVFKKEKHIPARGIGEVSAAVVYGGAFYIMAEEEKLGIRVLPENTDALRERAMELKRWVNANMDIRHPEKPEICGIYGVIIMSPEIETERGLAGRQICVFAEGAVDRSPCGTGTSARLALLASRGRLAVGDELEAAGIIGTKFTGRVESLTTECGFEAIVPHISGGAWITGFNKFVLDPADPLPEGFLI